MLNYQDILQALVYIRSQLEDFSPLFNRVIDEFYVVQTENIFDTDGLGTWDPTTRPNPILRDTYELFDSYTDRNSADFDLDIGTDEFSVRSTVFYADWHEYGWDRYNVHYPPRPVVSLIDDNDPTLAQIVQDYVNDIDQQMDEILSRLV